MHFFRRLVCTGLLFAACAALSPLTSAAETPNIVVILADDMGYGDAACFHTDAKIPTPNIDRLAREGMRFTDAHAAATVCVPSRYGLLTGRFPFRTEVKWNLPGSTIAADEVTLGGVLQRRGYATYGVGKWHLGFECDHPTEAGQAMPGGPVDRGFDRFFGMWASLDIPPYYYFEDGRCVLPPSGRVGDNGSEGWTKIQGAFWRGGGCAPDFRHEDVLPTFTEKAVGFIGDHASSKPDTPMLLYFALPAPHTPWLPTEEFEGESDVDMYGDFVMQVDAVVGQVLAALDANDMTDDTLVIFTSDNGPVWYDADEARFGHHAAGPYRGMKADLWEGGHRVPFVARWPGRIAPGTTCRYTISFTDVLPTAAAIVGAELSETTAPDGVSLLPALLEGDAAKLPQRTVVHTGTRSDFVAARRGPWKLIPRLGSCGFTPPKTEKPVPGGPTGQLYNLDDDPGETTNLWLARPDVVKEMEAALALEQAKE